jgi:CRP-like cAMP-binding protein
MEADLAISPRFAAEAAVANAPFEKTPEGALLNFPVVELRSFDAREAIFSEGETATDIFEILEGAVMVVRHLSGGRRQILDIAGPGRIIGLTLGQTHDCSAIALGKASVHCHDRRPDRTSLPPDVQLTAAMFDEIRRLRDLATSLGRKTAVERLAGFLLAMIPDEACSEAPVELVLPVSRPEIADHLGLVVETVCRNFTLLKRQGFIQVAGNYRLTIVDPSALRRMAAGESPRD